MGELVYGILLGIVIIVQSFALMYQMNQFSKREDDLIAAIIAKHVGEFALAQTEMRTKMKEKIDKLRAENELAIANQRIMDEAGIPVT